MLMILSGFAGGSPRLILSTNSMPETTSPNTVYCPSRKRRRGEADEELRIGRIGRLRARHAKRAARKGGFGEFGWHVGQVGAAHAGAGRVAGLGHEAVDHAMEDDAVVKALFRQGLDARDMLGREIGTQADHDASVLELHDRAYWQDLPRRGRRLPASSREAAPRDSALAIWRRSSVKFVSVIKLLRISPPPLRARLRRPLVARRRRHRRPSGRSAAPKWRLYAARKAGGKENGLDVRRHHAIHPGHGHFIIQIRAVAQSAHDQPRAGFPRRLDRQPVEGDDLEFAIRLACMGAQTSSIISTRSCAVNRGVLPGCTPMATTRRSQSRSAARITSTWPLVMGSKVPV